MIMIHDYLENVLGSKQSGNVCVAVSLIFAWKYLNTCLNDLIHTKIRN